jgi:hypothetical protein
MSISCTTWPWCRPLARARSRRNTSGLGTEDAGTRLTTTERPDATSRASHTAPTEPAPSARRIRYPSISPSPMLETLPEQHATPRKLSTAMSTASVIARGVPYI